MWPMIVNPDNNKATLASALAKMQGQYVSKFPELMAASLIACVITSYSIHYTKLYDLFTYSPNSGSVI